MAGLTAMDRVNFWILSLWSEITHFSGSVRVAG
jgi:hypothetical protein